ncbi:MULTISPECIES: helix-turn-helix domain-containing protein [unclassified Rhodococcus (in: high G+C Gram-positive bacteria)]|uniref:helix-turn-helix domain-containing protein n=1 Tax=unclassified Rhodococcus (in: high G+C Gram-positive bacteria) TaxID=192944 RepID=UPI0016396D16|nr:MULTISPECIES: helix-turn-helix domain-containing protein [unclassified Rhodococcus (in: high G+C Gram-positive bacteria)]MBC2640393.1 helix-turn-helix domain-containing protein [Rhodococcus sp. 3A]MBC2894861.1 helix-turn-helix domain-containing protein [Rhodococcus sp. 4CII]
MGPATSWDSIGAYRLTAVASADAIAEEAITPAVRSLLEHRNTDLRSTAEIYLAHAGDAAATAELNIHRQTLYFSRIEDLTGLDLAVGAHRLELHLGLYLGKFLGQFPCQ